MLKILVGVAAIAVIGFVGYFFWGEFQKAKEAQELADFSKRRGACLTSLDIYAGDLQNTVMKDDVDRCIQSFLLTADDINTAAKKHGR